MLAGIGVGVSSSVVPYVTDQLALARLPRATYALMVSLLPALATVIGIVVLAQIPSSVEVSGLGLVVAGVALHRPHQPGGDATSWPRLGPPGLDSSMGLPDGSSRRICAEPTPVTMSLRSSCPRRATAPRCPGGRGPRS